VLPEDKNRCELREVQSVYVVVAHRGQADLLGDHVARPTTNS